eukprot:TRINITY_DN9478_c0_g1_i1.p1 TRINITY_DN9478_c0_g1~~TRINITY_DN9478_c0_g1_i1.p1  ORF type:complete len:150 (-),score=18.08 TRINITY_DN9478_c0_g1_i1:335-784(-)
MRSSDLNFNPCPAPRQLQCALAQRGQPRALCKFGVVHTGNAQAGFNVMSSGRRLARAAKGTTEVDNAQCTHGGEASLICRANSSQFRLVCTFGTQKQYIADGNNTRCAVRSASAGHAPGRVNFNPSPPNFNASIRRRVRGAEQGVRQTH